MKKFSLTIISLIFVLSIFCIQVNAEAVDNVNLALGKSAEASSFYQNDSTYSPQKALDGSIDTRWAAGGSVVATQWIIIDLGTATQFNQVNCIGHTKYGLDVKKYIVEYSDDKSSWKEWGIKDPYSLSDAVLTKMPASARYIRITFPDTKSVNITEIQIFNVEYEFPNLKISDAKINNGIVSACVSFECEQNPTIIFSVYDLENKLIGISLKKFDKPSANEYIYMDISNSYSDTNYIIKAFMWDDINNIVPLSELKDTTQKGTNLMTQISQTTPNHAQQLQIDRKYGMFIHYGVNTFSSNGLEWSDGTLPASSFNPTTIDAEQWVKTAKDAGMNYVILVTKHHDGFSLFNTQYTEYSIKNSPNNTDVVKAVSDACKKYDMKLGLYYSLWDRHEQTYKDDKAYVQFMKNQITELLDGRYGEIVEFWLDGAWDKTNTQWGMDEIYDLVKTLQPNCVMGVNHTIGVYDSLGMATSEYQPANYVQNQPMKYFPSDFRLLDPQTTKAGDADPKLYMHRGQQYYLPFEATICVKATGKWFWSPSYPTMACVTPEYIATKYNHFIEQDNVLIVNCGPNRDGVIEEDDRQAIFGAARILGFAQGDALENIPKIDTYEFENAVLTAGSNATAFGFYDSTTSLKGYSGTGFIGGWTNESSAKFVVNSDTDRSAKISIQYINGNGATTCNISANGTVTSVAISNNGWGGGFVSTEYVDIHLNQGDNEIIITTGPQEKGPNLDCIYIK